MHIQLLILYTTPSISSIVTISFCNYIYEPSSSNRFIVSIMIRAKKAKRIKYEGDMLFQGSSDRVPVTVLAVDVEE